jgi:hypothetical protein
MCPICVRAPSKLQPLSTGLPWFYTSIIVGALFSRLLPACVLHQAALQLCRARTAMTICPDLVELPPGPGEQGHRVTLEH